MRIPLLMIAAALTAGGCASTYQLTLMPRDSGKLYQGVAEDTVLRPMYPGEDLGPAKERLLMFLEQYWGGPTTYSELRGHPRLRIRHASFPVGPAAKDHWLAHMRVAVEDLRLAPIHASTLWDYLERAAISLVNQREDTPR